MAASTSMIERVYPPLSCELRFSLITITPAARPSTSPVAQRPPGRGRDAAAGDVDTLSLIGNPLADVPSGER